VSDAVETPRQLGTGSPGLTFSASPGVRCSARRSCAATPFAATWPPAPTPTLPCATTTL